MKRIVVVEDRPWITKDATVELQNNGVEFYKTVYYPSVLLNPKDSNRLMADYCEKTGIDVITINSQREFLDIMEELYQIEELIFLIDYDLKGDMSVDDFFSRINIKYALEKRNSGEERIWFYTTGGTDVKKILHDNFKDRVIKTSKFVNSQIKWDLDMIAELIL